jgi:CheY-like chemotaxis protein
MKRVLVADDKPEGREFARVVLEASGYEVYEAPDGESAVEQARALHPDVIILDLHMPKLDGIGAVKAIRADSSLAATPVVALTASAMMGDREKILAAGFTAYLAKPIPLVTLRREVDRLAAGQDAHAL